MADTSKDEQKDRPTAKDIYDYLWHGRDFELEHLWQRSIFLGAFLLGIASVYAFYVKDIFIPHLSPNQITVTLNADKKEAEGSTEYTLIINPNNNPETKTSIKKDKSFSLLFTFGAVPILISLLGIIFSVLWIIMGKGSKAWYEIYESNLAKMSSNPRFWKSEDEAEGKSELDKIFCNKTTGRYSEYVFGRLKNCHGDPIDKSLFSTAAGSFSVSKVNIMIGIISFKFFILALFFHIYWLCKTIFAYPWPPILISFPTAILLLILLIYRLKKKLGSSYLDN
ncbi:hypothetical protein E4O05_00280 [Treponema sp. OMZ 787]|uniref:RipA family octameric membrane protein n=1 Tax=Treponema sp. OMZ 787 TaxID=2563669 RepID=UPI0020A36658|nr:hypothetical protein [Treponema sp. OMZ 787]UTC62394.1 hypothetical protein E4O05_00280 [Treponema sp. OMZ 787]